MGLFGRGRGSEQAGRGHSSSLLPPQLFTVHCIEGHPIRGRRTEGYQALRCPDCGAGVFVLPRSPLPEPPAPKRRPAPAAIAQGVEPDDPLLELAEPGWQDAPSGEAQDDAIAWTDAEAGVEQVVEPEPEPAVSTPQFDPELGVESSREEARRTSKLPTAAKAPAAAPPRAILVKERVPLRVRIARNRGKLVFAGVLFVMLGTAAWTVRRNLRRDYPHLAELGRTRGIEALDAGEFDRAHQILSEAARAVDSLGGQVQGADDVRQAAREAAIYVNLVGSLLETILDERARAADEASWESTFARQYEGRSILIEARFVEPGAGMNLDLDYRVLAAGPSGPRVGRLAVEDLELFGSTRPQPDDFVQFGAKLAGVESVADGNGWQFRLEPKSGVIMTRVDALVRGLNWQPVPFQPVEPARAVRREPFGRFLPRLLAIATIPATHQAGLPEVDPADLIRKPELIGRAVIVDDRVDGATRFNRGRNFNEIHLERAPGVRFLLPAKLSTEKPRTMEAVRLEGLLRKEGNGFVLDVTGMEEQPNDLARVDRALAKLGATDADSRSAWADWAAARGRAFRDAELEQRAGELRGQAIEIEATRAGPLSSQRAFELAEMARDARVPGPIGSALAHLGARTALADASTVAKLEPIVSRLDNLLPKSPSNAASPAGEAVAWLDRYANDPFRVYQKAPAPVREALDRRLVVEVVERWLTARAEADPSSALSLVDEAKRRAPDRPELARKLENRGLEAAEGALATLRQPEVEVLAARLRERREDVRANDLLRRWLRERQFRLAGADAQGRVALADLYESLVADPSAAATLLLEAIRIDPNDERAKAGLRRLGYRKVDDRWVAGSEPAVSPIAANPIARGDALMNRTTEEVRERMGGSPERVARSATQGQYIEQWIYRAPKGWQYINLLQSAGSGPSRVIGHYSLP